MRKRVTVFRGGLRRGINYDFEKLKKIFPADKEVKGIFAHARHWLTKKPLEISKFSDFEVNKDLSVTAMCTLNKKGIDYHEDGSFEKISVEIPGGKLRAIALLPTGVNSAIENCDFEQQDEFVIDFEQGDFEEQNTTLHMQELREEITNNIEDQIKWEEKRKMRDKIIEEVTPMIREKVMKELKEKYGDFEALAKPTFADLSEMEQAGIRAEIKAEMKKDADFEISLSEKKATALKMVEAKVPPAFRSGYEMQINNATKLDDGCFELVEKLDGPKLGINYSDTVANKKDGEGDFEEIKANEDAQVLAESFGINLK